MYRMPLLIATPLVSAAEQTIMLNSPSGPSTTWMVPTVAPEASRV